MAGATPLGCDGAPAEPVIVGMPPTYDHSGWHFEAHVRPLWGADQVDKLVKERNLTGGMPDMFCGDSKVRFVHRSTSTVVELSASDAFRCCSWRPPPPSSLQPSSASCNGNSGDSKDVGDSADNCGPPLGTVRCQFADRWRPNTENPDVRELEVTSDWTCSTAYWGTLARLASTEVTAALASGTSDADAAAVADGGGAGSTLPSLPLDMVHETEETLPFELLRRRDEILWYKEVLLWESELSDNGLCRAKVLVRVMPSFWFALLLCEVRVDNVLLREVATRLFSSFDSVRVLREWTWKEASYDDLRARGVDLSVDNASISQESVGTSLLGEADIRRQLRHQILLSCSGRGAADTPPPASLAAPGGAATLETLPVAALAAAEETVPSPGAGVALSG